MIRVDLHTHTNHSHARDSVRQMFEAGQKKGLLIQGFSEHSPRPLGYDYPSEYREHLAATFQEYIHEVTELKAEQKKHGITVLLGLEVDWLEDEVPYIKKMIQEHPYDYLIAGIHFLKKWGFDSSEEDWKKLSQPEKYACYERYYQTMIRMAETKLFHIVAHPDLIKIFSKKDFDQWLDLPSSMELITSALSAVRDAGMAMEISIAGTRKPCHEIYPGPKILHLAKTLGLPIAFASDSHATEQVAWHFEELEQYAAQAGWTESLVFQRGNVQRISFIGS
jgi:histidinol-phosphatase (PHP family)